MTNFDIILYINIIIVIVHVNCQRESVDYFESDVPPYLPSSPNAVRLYSPNSRQDGAPFGTGLAGGPVIPPPQNNPVNPLGPGPGGLGPGLPDGFAPFGLNHIILIIVPTFKAKFQKLPAWLSSTIKISMPITVFFDQLTVPPELLVPGIAGFPLPLGIPPPIGLRPPGVPVPPPPSPTSPAVTPTTGIAPPTSVQISPGWSSRPYASSTYEADSDDEQDAEDGYDSYYPEEERKRRWKRGLFGNQTQGKSRRRRAIAFNETIHAAERASLLPKLENLLENGGFGGKSCLLRTICEVHEAPLNHYGLLGELFTMFFSVSRSVFAASHLPEYLRAEEVGKAGNCSQYYHHCDNTIFSWEEVKRAKKKKALKTPYIVNVIDEVL